MLSIPRSAAQRMRNLIRKCMAGRRRGASPGILLLTGSRACHLIAELHDVIVSLRLPGSPDSQRLVSLPLEALDAVESASDDPVRIEPGENAIALHWTDRSVPRMHRFEVRACSEPPPRLSLPKAMAVVPPRFVTALHEAGRSAAKDGQRYVLHRLQIRGAAGEVIGTDAHIVVRFEGFALPFAEDLLVPAVPLFGLDEWSRAGEIRVGRTARTFIVATTDLTVGLRIDREGRYPDVDSIIPKGSPKATVTFDPDDALALLDRLPELPTSDEQHRPVTLELANRLPAILRARGPEDDAVVEVRLPRSSAQGGPVRLPLDRRYLARLLRLGARRLCIHAVPQPVVATGEHLTVVVMPLDPDLIVPPSASARVLTPDAIPNPVLLRSSTVKSSEPTPISPADGEILDPLIEAEALRNALAESLQRLGRLVLALRSRRKEQKALTQVWSSLKSLQLGG